MKRIEPGAVTARAEFHPRATLARTIPFPVVLKIPAEQMTIDAAPPGLITLGMSNTTVAPIVGRVAVREGALADDLAAVDGFLRSDPAARPWLRAAVETDARAPLPEQPGDFGYFAQAVEVIRGHADGRAMLCAIVARAEHQPQSDATTVHEAVPPPTPEASTPEATRPPRAWSRSDDEQGVRPPLALVPALPGPPPPAASLHDDGDAVVGEARANARFKAGLTELFAILAQMAAEEKSAGAPEAPSCGGAPSSSGPAAVSARDSFVAINSRGDGAASSVEEPRTSVVAGHAPVSSSGDDATGNARYPIVAVTPTRLKPSTSSTEQARREQPQHPQPIASPALADDLAAVDGFLRSDPAARMWLRAAVEADARAPLPEQPGDLGYFAQAVEVIRGHADGRAMLCAIVARAEHQPQSDATTVHEAVPPPTPEASTPEATRPPRAWGRSDDELPTSNSGCVEPHATGMPPWTSDEAMVSIGEAFAASARSCGAGEANAERELDVGPADARQEAQGAAAMRSTPTASTSATRPASRMRASARPARAILRVSRWPGTGARRSGARTNVAALMCRAVHHDEHVASTGLLRARGRGRPKAPRGAWRRLVALDSAWRRLVAPPGAPRTLLLCGATTQSAWSMKGAAHATGRTGGHCPPPAHHRRRTCRLLADARRSRPFARTPQFRERRAARCRHAPDRPYQHCGTVPAQSPPGLQRCPIFPPPIRLRFEPRRGVGWRHAHDDQERGHRERRPCFLRRPNMG
jgi:hypothetical protein